VDRRSRNGRKLGVCGSVLDGSAGTRSLKFGAFGQSGSSKTVGSASRAGGGAGIKDVLRVESRAESAIDGLVQGVHIGTRIRRATLASPRPNPYNPRHLTRGIWLASAVLAAETILPVPSGALIPAADRTGKGAR
jgi:hypothetical protein